MTDDSKAQTLDNLEAQLAGDTVPEKFRGKAIKDVLKSYSELETAHSRQGQELGEVRRLATSLSELETRASKDETPRQPVDMESLVADPDKAINEAIESHPAVRQATERSAQLERDLALANFEKKHPSFRETAVDSDFKTWVEGSVALRRIAAAADQYDLDAADTLFTLWHERKENQEQTKQTETARENRKRQERAGTLEGASGADSSSEVVINRDEMRELHKQALLGNKQAKAKWEDPKFQAMRRRAYMDKRFS